MIPLAFASLAAGAVVLIAGVTGSSLSSVARGKPDHSKTVAVGEGEGETLSTETGQVEGASETGAGHEGGGTGPQAPGLGLTREQADIGHPRVAVAPGQIKLRKPNRLTDAEIVVRQDFPNWTSTEVHERAVKLLAAQAASG